ncbi:hypothetical protein Pmani_004315 [Petrolisthes manimaculis]|uniref:Major facilitator superfamily (MFS) profile domain-containing protein n=1 Tax=Petrolisthes manimaculis TaxID=1843537 RepID=A0AAE1QH09_9EUCA|nr:hypothetical protein Pmani_004315 [Petrolisthes manimaculis]
MGELYPDPDVWEYISSCLLGKVVTVVSSGLVTTGAWTVHGFSALSLPQLTTPNSTLYLHPNQASWFATVTLLMGVPGSMVGGVLCEWMGPRRLQLVTSPLLCLTYLALHLVSWPSVRLNISQWPLLMVIRVTQGLLAAFLNAPSIVLPCEVSEATWRGTLASLLEVWVTLGFLLCYLMSGLISWKTAALLIPAITFIPGILGLLLVPESPSWLYRRQREAEAFNSLLKIRNSRAAVEKEMVEMKMLDQQDTKKLSWHHLLKMINQKAYAMPMVISVLVASLAVFCGFGVVAIYLPEVFAMTGVSRDQYWSSVISGSFRLLFNFIGVTV